MPKIKIKNNEIFEDIIGEAEPFPKYTTQIMNLANQNAQGTRPAVVGQMSDLIQEFPGNTFIEWELWYQNKMPGTIDRATEKIYEMIIKLNDAIKQINKDLVKKWTKDLIINKTYLGLKFQKSILKRIADIKNENYRLSTSEEESQGIDGYIGRKPISIKPITYETKKMYQENIEIEIIFYNKKKDGIVVEY